MNNFYVARKKNNLTQKQVAEYLSVTSATVSRYETEEMHPDPDTLKKLAHLYHCSIDYLLGVEDRNSFENIFSVEEVEILLRYRNLSDSQKSMLSDMISLWEQRNDKRSKSE